MSKHVLLFLFSLLHDGVVQTTKYTPFELFEQLLQYAARVMIAQETATALIGRQDCCQMCETAALHAQPHSCTPRVTLPELYSLAGVPKSELRCVVTGIVQVAHCGASCCIFRHLNHALRPSIVRSEERV